MAQLEDYGDLHPDAHMFFTKMQRENTDIITVNMTQLLIKAGLKELGGGSHHCAFQDEATSLQNHIQTNVLKRTGQHSKKEYIIISILLQEHERL